MRFATCLPVVIDFALMVRYAVARRALELLSRTSIHR